MAIELHHGGCHCGAVRYAARLDLEKPVIVCNCSICRQSGAMLSAISPRDFTLDQGEEALATYRFNTGAIAHRFCRTCGVKSFALLSDGDFVVNVRTLDDVDLDSLPIMPFDGAGL